MPESIVLRTFAAGELAPAYAARADLTKYLTGLRTCKNFFVRKEGGVSNRAGLRYTATVKNSNEAILLRYISDQVGESVLIEMGNGYFRFFLNGAPVELSAVTAWSAATAYVVGDIASRLGINYYAILGGTNHQPPNATYWYPMPAALLEIPHHFGAHKPNWDQSAQVITLTHGEAATAELVYGGLTTWVLRLVTTTPWAAAPTGVGGSMGGTGNRFYAYAVTAARAETYEETDASAPFYLVLCAEPTPDAPNVLSWNPVAGAVEYYVYCDPFNNNTFGFIGTATEFPSFNDVGLAPDFAVTPPIARDLFEGGTVYPDVSVMHQQRRVFARWPAYGDQVDLSRTGFPSNFGITSPMQDDDAIRFKLAGSSNHGIYWAVSLSDLILGTWDGIWVVRGANEGGVLVPGSIDAKERVHVGSHDKPPVVSGNAIIYLQARGKIFRDVRFDQSVAGLDSRDLTIFSSHLFEPTTFAAFDYAETPHSIIWCVRNDGILLGLTYIPEQEVWGWHRHDTQLGAFEEVCIVPEAGEDIAYFIVRRTIDGETVRYIERMESRYIRETDGDFAIDAFFVDAGLSYHGTPANSFSGLEHLEGAVVAVLADGEVLYNGDPDGAEAALYTIADGTLDLPGAGAYEDVHIGLAIRYADIETLDLDVQGSSIRDKPKRVQRVSLLIDRSARSFWAGPDAAHLRPFTRQAWEIAGDAHTGQVSVNLTSAFTLDGRVLIRMTDPLPLTILGVVPSVEIGG